MNRPLWLRLLLALLYSCTILVMLALLRTGLPYYDLPLHERPHHALHAQLKSSGSLGLALGIVGTAMMLLMLLYIPRKRLAFMQGWGDLRHWLDLHIWLGVTGTILVTFHSAFIVGGVVSIAFWSMVAVALSGVLGRYLYVQIPRGINGRELSRRELEENLGRTLKEIPGGLSLLEEISHPGALGLGGWLLEDLFAFLDRGGLKRRLRRQGHEVSREVADKLGQVLRLRRRIRRLERLKRLLHHWHVIHRPFALVMYLILLVHVGAALYYSFSWR